MRVREAHKSINPEGWWQRFRGDGGRIARARSAQVHQPGGVVAKVSGRRGTNPYRKTDHRKGFWAMVGHF